MLKKIYLLIFTTIISMIITGCNNTAVIDPGGSGQVKTNPVFSTDIQPLFTSSCTPAGCHNSSSANAGLALSEGLSYGNLVNIDSTLEPLLKRVLPSDTKNSYIIIKLEGKQTVGEKMPEGGSLSLVLIQNIKNWINNGAVNN